jgi:hypothetical protein
MTASVNPLSEPDGAYRFFRQRLSTLRKQHRERTVRDQYCITLSGNTSLDKLESD